MRKIHSLTFVLIVFFNSVLLGQIGFYADGLKVDTAGCLNFKNSFIVLKAPASKYVKYFIMVKSGVYQVKGSHTLLWNSEQQRSKLHKHESNGYLFLPFSGDNIRNDLGANNVFEVGKNYLALFAPASGFGGMALKKQMKTERGKTYNGYLNIEIYGKYIVKVVQEYNPSSGKVEDVAYYEEDHIGGIVIPCKKKYFGGNPEDTIGYNLMNCKITGKPDFICNLIWKNGSVNISPDNGNGSASSVDFSKDINSQMTKADASGKAIPYIEKYNNGAIQVEGTTINGVNTGVWKRYSSAGVLLEKTEYGATPSDRKVISYYNDGNKEFESNYKNNNREGPQMTYYIDGKLKTSVTYVNEKKEGEEIIVGTAGEKEITTYKNDEKNGPYKELDKNGKPIVEGNYKNGKKDGTWKEYEKGVLTKTEKWNKGELIQ